jgi:hypothetical protein
MDEEIEESRNRLIKKCNFDFGDDELNQLGHIEWL